MSQPPNTMSQPASNTSQRPVQVPPQVPSAAVQGQPFPGTQYSQQQPTAPQGLAQYSQMPPQRPMAVGMQYPSAAPSPTLTGNTLSQFNQAMRQQQASFGQQARTMGTLQGSATSMQTGNPSNSVPRPSLQSMARPAEQGPRKYNKKRKLPDVPAVAAATAPPKVTPQVRERYPRSEVFTQAQELDVRVAEAVAQQKAVARIILRANEHVKKKLRIYIQSEHLNQVVPGKNPTGDPPSWTFCIWGKLIESVDGLPSLGGQQPLGGRKFQAGLFTFYVRRLTVSLEGRQGDGDETEEMVWDKGSHEGDHRDRFHIRRRGSDDVKVRLTLELDSHPELCNLSPQLAGFMGCRQHTKAAVLQSLLAHIRMHNLQDAAGKVRCDPLLRTLFKEDSLEKINLATLLENHLSKNPPYPLEYTIRPSSGAKGEISCYDLDLYVAMNPNDQQSCAALDGVNADPKIEQLQAHINSLVIAASERGRRHDMLLAFANNPADYINGIIATQGREVRGGPKGSGVPQSLRRTQLFEGRWVDDAALRYLHRKMAAGA